MLQVQEVSAHYGSVQALWGVSFNIAEKEIVTIIGPNGAGKSTLVKAIAGLISASSGEIQFMRDKIGGLRPYAIARRGISLIPEDRAIFPRMTVLDNLLLGAYGRKQHEARESCEWIFRHFPILRTKSSKMARTLSGGEQQMLAIARSLMSKPKLLMLDEPSLGLAPIMVEKILDTIVEINEEGMTILLVEQNVQEALQIAHRAYVLEEGRIIQTGTARDLANDDRIKRAYLGM